MSGDTRSDTESGRQPSSPEVICVSHRTEIYDREGAAICSILVLQSIMQRSLACSPHLCGHSANWTKIHNIRLQAGHTEWAHGDK